MVEISESVDVCRGDSDHRCSSESSPIRKEVIAYGPRLFWLSWVSKMGGKHLLWPDDTTASPTLMRFIATTGTLYHISNSHLQDPIYTTQNFFAFNCMPTHASNDYESVG
jgi:hypothetical protein